MSPANFFPLVLVLCASEWVCRRRRQYAEDLNFRADNVAHRDTPCYQRCYGVFSPSAAGPSARMAHERVMCINIDGNMFRHTGRSTRLCGRSCGCTTDNSSVVRVIYHVRVSVWEREKSTWKSAFTGIHLVFHLPLALSVLIHATDSSFAVRKILFSVYCGWLDVGRDDGCHI